jgi:hypothetical protein
MASIIEGIYDYIAVKIPLHTNFLNSRSSLVVPKNALNWLVLIGSL